MDTNGSEYNDFVGKIGDWYAEAETEILAAIARRLARGIDEPNWYDQKLSEIQAVQKEVRGILQNTLPGIRPLLTEAIKSTFMRAFNNGDKNPPIPTKANLSVVETLARVTYDRLQAVNVRVVRSVSDIFRAVIAEAVGVSSTGAITRAKAAGRALARFANAGITGFLDKKGRKWGIAEYTEMATRTTLTQARVEGNLTRYAAEGYKLVTIPPSPEPCQLCDPFENKVFTIEGKHPEYKPLKDAISAGLFHPNCTHRAVPYIPGLTKFAERKPKEERRAAYDERQQQRAIERDIRQWKRRLAAALTPEEQAKAKAKIKEKQAAMRAFIDDTGRLRDSRRENLGTKPPKGT